MEPPNKLMIMQALGYFRDDSLIPNGLTRIFSGAPCVIRGVLGEIGVICSLGGARLPPQSSCQNRSRYKSSGQVPSKHIDTRIGFAISQATVSVSPKSQAGVPVIAAYLERSLASASDSARPCGSRADCNWSTEWNTMPLIPSFCAAVTFASLSSINRVCAAASPRPSRQA